MGHVLTCLVRAALIALTLPVAIVADFLTLSGLLIRRDTPHTFTAALDFVENVLNAADPYPEHDFDAVEPPDDEQDH